MVWVNRNFWQIRNILRAYIESTPCNEVISQELWDLLTYHKIDQIYASVATNIPDSILKQITFKKRQIIELYNEYKTELNKIILQFQENSIDYVILKGWSNATFYYNNLYDRYYGDIDILICEKDINKVEKIMKDEGYFYGQKSKNVMHIPDRKEIVFQRRYTHEMYNMVKVSEEKCLNFDFNYLFAWRCFGNEYINKVETDIVYQYSMNASIKNECFRIFDVNMQFLHLCCHFTNEALYFMLNRDFEGGDPGELKLFRLMDIVLLIKKINANTVEKLAEKLQCRDRIDYAMKIAKLVLGEEYIDGLLKWDISNNSDINYYYTRDGAKKEWPISVYTRIFDLTQRNVVCKELFL